MSHFLTEITTLPNTVTPTTPRLEQTTSAMRSGKHWNVSHSINTWINADSSLMHSCFSHIYSHKTHTLTLLRSKPWCHCAPQSLWALKSVTFRVPQEALFEEKINSHNQRTLTTSCTQTHSGLWFHSYRSTDCQASSLTGVYLHQLFMLSYLSSDFPSFSLFFYSLLLNLHFIAFIHFISVTLVIPDGITSSPALLLLYLTLIFLFFFFCEHFLIAKQSSQWIPQNNQNRRKENKK